MMKRTAPVLALYLAAISGLSLGTVNDTAQSPIQNASERVIVRLKDAPHVMEVPFEGIQKAKKGDGFETTPYDENSGIRCDEQPRSVERFTLRNCIVPDPNKKDKDTSIVTIIEAGPMQSPANDVIDAMVNNFPIKMVYFDYHGDGDGKGDWSMVRTVSDNSQVPTSTYVVLRHRINTDHYWVLKGCDAFGPIQPHASHWNILHKAGEKVFLVFYDINQKYAEILLADINPEKALNSLTDLEKLLRGRLASGIKSIGEKQKTRYPFSEYKSRCAPSQQRINYQNRNYIPQKNPGRH